MPSIDDATYAALNAFPKQLETYFAAFPERFRHWAPTSWNGVPSEPLTAIQQVCHVRDIEIDGYQVRIERTLRESVPLLAPIDTEALARDRHYEAAEAAVVLQDFRSARARTMVLLADLQPLQLRRKALFAGYGGVTLIGLIHYLASHDQQHLAGLQWLLGKLHSESAAP